MTRLALLLDMDGVLYRGRHVLPGVPEALAQLEAAGHELCFATNNGWASAEEISERLQHMGITIRPERMATAAWAAAELLQSRWPAVRRPFVLGSAEVARQLRDRGMQPVAEAEHESADALVVGIDLELTYRKLARAQAVGLRGVPFLATDMDGAYPWEDGWLPGSGSIVAAVERATGRTALPAGKPEPFMYRALLRGLSDGLLPVVVGDNLGTDIRAGRAAGFTTILVLSGIATAADAANAVPEERPDHVVADLATAARDIVPHLR
ncbi:MAG: HAD-IIA family hydrolase [Chloroflexota bacterium]